MFKLLALLTLALTLSASEVRAERSDFKLTAYCLTGYTRTGTWTERGTVAVDPRVIPLGSRLWIQGLSGIFRAEDTGSGVIGNHVDIWMSSCDEAIDWGVQYRNIEVLTDELGSY